CRGRRADAGLAEEGKRLTGHEVERTAVHRANGAGGFAEHSLLEGKVFHGAANAEERRRRALRCGRRAHEGRAPRATPPSPLAMTTSGSCFSARRCGSSARWQRETWPAPIW